MATNNEENEGLEAPLTGGAYYAATLFDRHGVAVRAERTRLVQSVLKLEYRAAHRRVRGEFPFTFEELGQLAAHFGETLNELFAAAAAAHADTGTFSCGSFRVSCKFWRGGVAQSATPTTLVARQQGSDWLISPAGEATGAPLYTVKQVMLDTQANLRKRVAVLDDDRDITDSLCQYLVRSGYLADAYHSIDALAKAAMERAYDVYILDWLVGRTTVGELIAILRTESPEAVIAVLTGKAESGRATDSEIIEALASSDLLFFQKPMALPIMVTQIARRLATARP